MSAYEDSCGRHQQTRWLRPDADRWVRTDAARFLPPGADVARAYPALARKYRPDQPRVPAGNGRESGRWTDRAGGGGSVSRPMGAIDFGDLPNFSELFGLFKITPSEVDNTGYSQLAGDEALPPLRRIHPDSTYENDQIARGSLRYWREQPTERIVESLRPDEKNTEALGVLRDGRVYNGNTRLKILEERGYNINSLPRQGYPSQGGGGSGARGGGLFRYLAPWM